MKLLTGLGKKKDIREKKEQGPGTQELSPRMKFLMGITLFSMFFGAGNLIFPPYLGAQAGTNAWAAFAGFAVSAVGLPVLGVIAVTVSGGLSTLASRVHPKFAFVYIAVLYLAIGPCLAIPRTASTSFSMAAPPFLPESVPEAPVQLLYTLVFFTATSLVAMHPEKLTEYLGKKLTPVLLLLIVVLFAAAVWNPAGPAADPAPAYESLAPVAGFLYGYQTMDTLAALNFGMLVAINVRERGIREALGGLDSRSAAASGLRHAHFYRSSFQFCLSRYGGWDGSSDLYGAVPLWKGRSRDSGCDFCDRLL